MVAERDERAEFFGPLGLDRPAELAYRAITEGRGDEIGADALEALVATGLIRIEDGRAVALPARLAVERWAADREAEIESVRTGAERFNDSATATSGPPLIETLRGAEAVRRALGELRATARRQLRSFELGPVATGPVIDADQQPALARGVHHQAVYQQAGYQQAGPGEELTTAVLPSRAVDDARVFPKLPLRMTICDDRMALIVLATPRPREQPSPDDVDGLVVHPSPLLDALVQLFTTFWDLAVPVELSSPLAADGDDPQREVLRLLAAGLTDAAIARELGISERTVHRRIGRLQQMLGATSRFLLGVQANRRGWI